MLFPDRSAGKESAYNAGDPGSISELGSSPGERIGYPFQYSWASLVAQTIKNLIGDFFSPGGKHFLFNRKEKHSPSLCPLGMEDTVRIPLT